MKWLWKWWQEWWKSENDGNDEEMTKIPNPKLVIM